MRPLNEILTDVLDEKRKQNVLLTALARLRGTTIEPVLDEVVEGEDLAGILENILVQEKRTTELLDRMLIAGR